MALSTQKSRNALDKRVGQNRRLRKARVWPDYAQSRVTIETAHKAADRIEALEAENERLREVLGFAMRTLEAEGFREDGPTMTRIRAALEGKQ